MECKTCFLKQENEFFDHVNKKLVKVKLNEKGLCQKCSKALEIFPIFEDFVEKAKKYSYSLLKNSKKPVTIFLSGGKDSTVAVLRSLEYGWKIKTFTVLKSPNLNPVESKIKTLSEKYGFDATIKKINSKLVEDFYKFCFRINISPCKYCGLVFSQPVLNKFKLEEKPPIVIDGIDFWTVFNAFFEFNLYKKGFTRSSNVTKAVKYWFLAIIMALLGLVEAISGFVLWFGFPTGTGGGGRGYGGGGIGSLTFWELSKHTWIDIHGWVAIALAVIVAIHVVLHWKWITRVASSLFRKKLDRLAPVLVNTNDSI